MARRVTEGLVGVARAAIADLNGQRLTAAALEGEFDRVWAVGKAASAMARAAPRGGSLIISKSREDDVKVMVAAHPVPDERSVAATRAILDEAASANGRVLLLISGGTSSLIGGPVEGVPLETMREATRALLAAGAKIGEINVVRRHLGAALGGKLARAARGVSTLEVLLLSDVVTNELCAIGSGPAAPDPSTLDDARAIAKKFSLPPAVSAALAIAPETPKPGDEIFSRVRHRILATPMTLLERACEIARARGFEVEVRGELVSEDVDDLAAELAARAKLLQRNKILVAVGEPTVRVRGDGVGGRAQHLSLLLARAIAGSELSFVAVGSDGSDGPTAAAGAAVDGDTWHLAQARGLDPSTALARFDSHPLLTSLGSTIVSGPTGTNLTDLLLLSRGA